MKLVQVPQAADLLRHTHGFMEDFDSNYVSGDAWTATLTDSGTATLGDTAGGVLTLTASDGTVADNDEAYIERTKENFKIVADKPLELEAYVKFTEANTDDANIFVGLIDAIAANTLQDDGAGMDTSFSGACFFKVDGGTTWKVIYSDGSTQTIVELTAANSLDGVAKTAGGAYQRLRIEINPHTSTKCDVNFFIDDVHVYRMKDKTYANATEAQVGAGVKNGGANNESLLIDYVYCYQKR